MKRPTIATLLALSVLTAACGLLGPSSDSPVEEVREARDRWRALGIDDYDYVVRRSCFCLEEVTREVRIAVRDGQVVDRRYVVDDTAVHPDYADIFTDLDTQFERLLEQARAADRFDGHFGATGGLPFEVHVDQMEQAADDEYSIRASDLTPR